MKNRIKRYFCVLLAIIMSFSLCACGNVNVNFEKAVEKGDYTKALELFINTINPYAEKREQAYQFLQQYIDNAISDFNDGKIDYDKACGNIATVAWLGVISNVTTSDAFDELDTLQESKASYNAAISLLDKELYMDALYNFQDVVEEDSNYSDAQEKIASILTDVLADLTEEVNTLADNRDYRQALESIDEVIRIIGNSVEIETLQKEIEAKYIDYSLSRAEEAFNSDGDYASAAAIVVATMDDVGADARLTSALEEYQSYVPVYLTDLDYFDKKGPFYYTGSGGEDNLGNEYHNYLYFSIFSPNESSVTYYLGGNYSKFSGTCALQFGHRTYSTTTVFEFYGDSTLLFTSNALAKGVVPQDFSIDVSNVTCLEIVARTSSTYIDSAAIYDAVLAK